MAHRKTFDFSNFPVVSRADARGQGLKRYFTGEPCAEGHIAPRYTRGCSCVICEADTAREWQRQMYLNDPDEFRRRVRVSRKKNPLAALIRGAKTRAKKRGIEFTLTCENMQMPEDCECCGVRMQVRDGEPVNGGTPESPSLDRLDAKGGYTPDNVKIICWRCNNLKRDATVEEMRRVLAYMEANKPQKLRLVS